MPRRSPRSYDHRIKEQIIRAGDPGLFPQLEIPRSTAASWIRRGLGQVVSLDPDEGGLALRDRVAKLERRVAMLTAVLRLVLALLRVSGFTLERAQIPDAAGKRRLLGAVERARLAMPLSAALRVLRLSAARYHAWVRAGEVCTLDDRPSCPRSMPQRLTYSAFYVTEHNQRIPHAAFDGQTPDEIYFGRGADVPHELAAARREARKHRVELNRAMACTACPRGTPTPSEHLAA